MIERITFAINCSPGSPRGTPVPQRHVDTQSADTFFPAFPKLGGKTKRHKSVIFLSAIETAAPALRAMSLKCQERITRWITSVRRKEKFLAIDAV